MPFETTLPDRTTASTREEHVNDHLTIHGILQGKPWYNPLDYGVTAAAWVAGNADGSAAVQAAVDACASDGGGIVFMPPGSPRWDSPVSIDEADGANYQKVSLWGPGSGALVIDVNHNGKALFFGTSRGLADSLTAPKAMSSLQGFRIEGPGKGTAGSIGIHTKEASYYAMRDVQSFDFETAFYFDSGHSFSTGGYHEWLRTLGCKYGYIINDKGEGGTSAGEYTDGVWIRCYTNCGGGQGSTPDSVGWWLLRSNTCHFYSCSAEAFDYPWVLGGNASGPLANPAGTGRIAARNWLFACRAENEGVQQGTICTGSSANDNYIFGGNVAWDDQSNQQQNVIVGSKFSVAGDAQAAKNVTRLIRPITAAKLPTANEDTRGEVFIRPGNSGVKDQLVWCMKGADDQYSWVDLSV